MQTETEIRYRRGRSQTHKESHPPQACIQQKEERKSNHMINREPNTSRISIRCSGVERCRISLLAERYGLNVSDFIRESIVIAIAKVPDKQKWRRSVERAIQEFAEESPWTAD